MIMPPSNDDLQNIVKSWYPNLESLTKRLIGGFHCMLFENRESHNGCQSKLEYVLTIW